MRAFWLCVVHTLNKRFRGKAMRLVCKAQSSKRRIYFFGLQPACRRFCTRAFSLCDVHTLNKRFRWESVSCWCSAKFQAQNLLFGFQPPCRCFYMRAFSLCVVHTLNKRFRGEVMWLFFKNRCSLLKKKKSRHMQKAPKTTILSKCWLARMK